MLYKDKVIVDGDSKGDSFLIALSRDDGQDALARRSHPSRDQLQRPADPRDGRPHAIDPVRRPLRDRASIPTRASRSGRWTAPRRSSSPRRSTAKRPDWSSSAAVGPSRSCWRSGPTAAATSPQTHVAWRDNKGAPYVPSLIVAGDFLLSVNNAGVAFCYEAATGKVLWQEKLGRHHASPVLVDGLVFFINDDGEINVIKPGAKFERVAQVRTGRAVLRLARDQRRPGLPARFQAPLLHRQQSKMNTPGLTLGT